MKTNDLVEKIREAARRTHGRNARTTVAWDSRDEWVVDLPEQVKLSRKSRGKSELIRPTIVVEVVTSDSHTIDVCVSVRDEPVNSTGAALAPLTQCELAFQPEWDSRGGLTDESDRALRRWASQFTTYQDGLSPAEAEEFLAGGPVRPE